MFSNIKQARIYVVMMVVVFITLMATARPAEAQKELCSTSGIIEQLECDPNRGALLVEGGEPTSTINTAAEMYVSGVEAELRGDDPYSASLEMLNSAASIYSDDVDKATGKGVSNTSYDLWVIAFGFVATLIYVFIWWRRDGEAWNARAELLKAEREAGKAPPL